MPTSTIDGDPYIIIEGGLVQNDPALPVFDLDVLADEFPDANTAQEIQSLRERALAEKLRDLQYIADACERWLAEHPDLSR